MVKVEDFERNLSPRFSYQNLKYIIQEYKRRYKEIDSIFRKEDLIFDIFNRDKEIDENKFNLEKVLENKKNLDIEIANNFQNIL